MTGALDVPALARRIRALQAPSGRIAWIDAGIFDPWNHVEAAMGLAAAGDVAAARRAFDHLLEIQRDDGAWPGQMGCAAPLDAANERLAPGDLDTIVDTNFTAYPATGLLHLIRITGARRDLDRYGPAAARGLDFVLAHQRADGAIAWRERDAGEDLGAVGALRAGSAAIYRSLEGGVRLADMAGRPRDDWAAARARLGRALRDAPETAWLDKTRYAMDWYYPALSGALGRAGGRARLAAAWRRFVHRDWGCRCVVDEPWATAAETAELAITAAACGGHRAASRLLDAVAAMTASHGGLWMGRQFALDIDWPKERPSWTAGAAILAVDAVHRRTPGAAVFLETLPEAPAPAARTASSGA